MTIEPEPFVLATIVATTAESVGQRQVSQDGPSLVSWGLVLYSPTSTSLSIDLEPFVVATIVALTALP